jgi:hypothetical protein
LTLHKEEKERFLLAVIVDLDRGNIFLLMDKVKNIMDSDLPPEQKQSTAAPYLQQIQELQQQLQEMMAAGHK